MIIFSEKDTTNLKTLAAEKARIGALPIQKERQMLWSAINRSTFGNEAHRISDCRIFYLTAFNS